MFFLRNARMIASTGTILNFISECRRKHFLGFLRTGFIIESALFLNNRFKGFFRDYIFLIFRWTAIRRLYIVILNYLFPLRICNCMRFSRIIICFILITIDIWFLQFIFILITSKRLLPEELLLLIFTSIFTLSG